MDFAKQTGGGYVGTIREKQKEKKNISILDSLYSEDDTSVRGWSPVLCTEFLEMWTGLSVKATGPLCQQHHFAMLINIFFMELTFTETFDFKKKKECFVKKDNDAVVCCCFTARTGVKKLGLGSHSAT